MKKKLNIKDQNKNFETQMTKVKTTQSFKGQKYTLIFLVPFRNIFSKIIKLKSYFKK